MIKQNTTNSGFSHYNLLLTINNVRHLGKDEVSVKRSGGVTTLRITYEERRAIVGNLSLVMSFDDSIELIAN